MSRAAELDRAIQKQQLTVVEKLLQGGCDPNVRFRDGRTPLARAALTDKALLIRALVAARADINGVSSPNGDTALGLAAGHGLPNAVQQLIDLGADPNQENALGLTPLCLAALHETEDHLDVVRLLIAAHADVNRASASTPLMCACLGLPEAVRLLLDAGADVNAVRPQGIALHLAIENNQPEMVSALLEHGASLTLRTPSTCEHPGLTPLELAKRLKRRKIVELLERAAGLPAPASSSTRLRSSVADSWSCIVEWLRTRKPGIYRSLRKAAGLAGIEKVGSTVGEILPDDFRMFYSIVDGQREGSKPLVPPSDVLEAGYRLLRVRDMMSDWRMLTRLEQGGEFAGNKATTDRAIRKQWWNPKWAPFAGDGHGDYLCVDLDPTSFGTKGQVILVNHESGRRKLLASSFTAWLSDLCEQLTEDTDA